MSTREERLATVLRVRRVQEDQRRADLARATEAEQHAERAIAAAEAHLANRSRALPRAATTVGEFLAGRQVVAGRAHRVATAVAEHALAEGETDRSRARLTEARTRTSGLERLLDRAVDARRAVVAAADQAVAEESLRARGVQG